MQLAHPAVARGVLEHSRFRRDPFERLRRTLEPTLTITFGDHRQAAGAADAVNEVHLGVRGRMSDGSDYEALDPELLLWVHATLVDSALVAYERFVARILPSGRERYYAEMGRQATALKVPAEMLPSTYEDFRAYVGATMAGLEVGDDARSLRDDVLSPPVSPALAPVSAWLRALTVAMLPPALVDGFGLHQTAASRLTLETTGAALRGLLPMLPDTLRRWPHARAAARRLA